MTNMYRRRITLAQAIQLANKIMQTAEEGRIRAVEEEANWKDEISHDQRIPVAE